METVKRITAFTVLVALVALVVFAPAEPASAQGATRRGVCMPGRWVKSVAWTQGKGGHWRLEVDPTTAARTHGRSNVTRIWNEISNCPPVPLKKSFLDGTSNGMSALSQLACHALFSVGAFGTYTGGATWGLETDRRPINPAIQDYVRWQCNWGTSQF